MKRRPVVLCILDGWGDRPGTENNAVALARTPTFDRLRATFPGCRLSASGEDVGLPDGQFGNSEVGHMNLGAGRVIRQELVRIGKAIREGELRDNPALVNFIAALKDSGGRCHLMGLLSPGGVHAHQDHAAALAALLDAAGVPVVVHVITDGRDTPPDSASGYVERFSKATAGLPGVALGTVAGRYFAMDRDKRWDRVEKAFRAFVHAEPRFDGGAVAAIRAAHDAGTTDEFVPPAALAGFDGMRDGDGLLFTNFRGDRAREILTALLDPAFDGFARGRVPKLKAACGMVAYGEALSGKLDVLFPAVDLKGTMGEAVAAAGLKQLRVAETEKYPHVTYFFNGGEENPFPGEERVMVPSPEVATYDLQPEMSAPEVTKKVVEAVNSGRFDFVLVNFANPDMVGHTGVLEAAIRAVETVDAGLGRLVEAVEAAGGVVLVTADHGNCETMVDPETGAPHTAHTTNLVPCVLVGVGEGARLADGRLADVAPTLLRFLGVAPSSVMEGRDLTAGT